MNNWNHFAPDYNPPQGMPQGFPYALNPNLPSANPLCPSAPPSYQSNLPAMNSAYPPNIPYGYPGSGSNPAGFASPANNAMPYPSPNASGSPYPPVSSPYAPASSPYSSGSSPYPFSGSSPYPSSGSSPYPSSGSSPYPSSGSSPYPSSGSSPYPSGASPYPSGASPYPSGASPYPSGASPYPSGASPYPASASPYPASSSPYPTSSSAYSNSAGSLSSFNSPSPRLHEALSPSGNTASPYPTIPHYQQNKSPLTQSRNMAYLAGEGTVVPYPGFDPKQDAEVLRKAMKGFGTDEKAIISVLSKRSNSQRVYIAVAFKQLYGKDLIDDLKSELNGNFEQVILGLMMSTNDYLASELHKAMSGVGTDEDVLIEILCSRTNQEIWAINEAYVRLYGKPLEEDIKSDTSGHFQRLLVSACTGARSEAPADSERAKQTAETLYQAGAGQWGTDESVFNSILVAESFQQLGHTFYEYQKLTGQTVVQAIGSEMSGDLKQGMLAIAKCVENRPFYFAEKLYKAMKVGLGTDDNTLIRVIVSRCEIDMVQIKAEYERNYGKPLVEDISGDTSGDYKKVLFALVNPH